jgi:hypothetical protein
VSSAPATRPTAALRGAVVRGAGASETRAEAPVLAPRRRPTRLDVLFGAAVGLLLAVHLTIFLATLVLAPVAPSEARNLELVQLPVEVARVLVLPFHALLLGSLFVLGRRAAGRWAGFGAMLAVLALDLRADVLDPIYGPPTAEGGWIAASLLAFAFVLLPRYRLAAAAMVGLASGFFAIAALALPAFLGAIALFPPAGGRKAAWKAVGSFAGAWAVPAVGMQLIWLAMLKPAGWSARADEFTAMFGLHPVLPYREQVRLVFAAWHFAPLVTLALASFLFLAAGTGVARYFLVPKEGEAGPAPLRVARRFPVELWAGVLTVVLCSIWWGLSGSTLLVGPNLPVIAAIVPLITAMAYRGAKWLLTVNRFWALCAVLYLVGLILARTIQLLITLVQAFQY